MEHKVYLGLGGNIGDTLSILQAAMQQIAALDVADFKRSRFYQTSPVSEIPQAPYVNAVCEFRTNLGAKELLTKLQQIEINHGKVNKPKDAARVVDIDLLFFGLERHCSHDCEIPHPRWKERLFVIIPLADLTTRLAIPGSQCDNIEYVDLVELIRTFPNKNNETVSPLLETN